MNKEARKVANLISTISVVIGSLFVGITTQSVYAGLAILFLMISLILGIWVMGCDLAEKFLSAKE